MRLATWASSVVRNRTGGVPRPSWCTYLVTYRCNARCQMCDSWQIPPGEELTPAEVGQVFAKIGRLDIVRLSGGEPFLRPDLLEIAQAVLAASQPSVIHITTNGSYRKRVEHFVRTFSQPRRLRFMVSFDGVGATHDANRGPGVPFRRAADTVRMLASYRATHGIEVSANHTVISPQSMAENGELKRILGADGVDVHSVLAYADSAMYTLTLQGRTADHMIVPTGYPLHPKLAGADAIGFVRRELAEVSAYRNPLLRWGKRYYLRGLLARLEGERHPKPQPPCVELRSHIRLLPDGSVPVCQFNTQKVGNLKRQSFDEVWNGSHAGNGHTPTPPAAPADAGSPQPANDIHQWRQWVTDCPGCWAECEVMPSAIYTADILRA